MEEGDVDEILLAHRADKSSRIQLSRPIIRPYAASDNNPHTYAGDYQGGSLPIGTAVVSQYLGYAQSNAFVDPTGRTLPNSHANTWYEVTRATYFAEFANRPLVIEADLPFATLTNVNVPGTNNAVAGGLVDPVIHLTYFLITDAKLQRWLGLTSFSGCRSGERMTTAQLSMPPRQTSSPSLLRSVTRKALENFRRV